MSSLLRIGATVRRGCSNQKCRHLVLSKPRHRSYAKISTAPPPPQFSPSFRRHFSHHEAASSSNNDCKDDTTKNITADASMNMAISGNLQQTYLHVAPCGDYWTGTTIFAAKHLQPDYVKSVPIPDDFDVEHYFENVLDEEEGRDLLNQIYDNGVLPPGIVD